MARKGKATAQVDIEFRALVGQLSADLKSVTGELSKTQNKINSTMSAISKTLIAGFSVGATIYGIKKLSDAINNLAQEGDKAADIADSFRALGGASQSIEEAKQRVLGAVGAFDLMQIANEGLLKGIPELNKNFGTIAEYGTKIAQALGIDAKEGIDQVTQALSSVKDKQLLAIGITLDSEKAYRDYGKQIGLTGKQLEDAEKYLTDNQKKLALQAQALQQVTEKSKDLAEVGKGVAQAQEAVATAASDAYKEFGIGIEKTDELQKGYNQLEAQIQKIDWASLGASAGQFFAILANAAASILPSLTTALQGVATGLDVAFGDVRNKNTQKNILGLKFSSLKEEKENLLKSKDNQLLQGKLGQAISGAIGLGNKAQDEARIKEIDSELASIESTFNKISGSSKQTENNTEKLKKQLQSVSAETGNVSNNTKGFKDDLEKARKEAEKTKEEIEKLGENWQKYLKNFDSNSSEDQLNKLIDSAGSGNIQETFRQFDELRNKAHENFVAEFTQDWKEAIEKGAITSEEVAKQAEREWQPIAEKMGDDLSEALERAAQNFNEKLTNGFDKTLSSITPLLDQLSPGLGGQIGSALNSLSDQDKADSFEWILEQFNMGGEDAAASLSDAFASGAKILSAVLNAKGIDKETSSNQGTGGAIGAAAGSFFGPIGAQVGQAIGSFVGGLIKWGSQNPETNARHAFSNFIEEGFKKLEQISFYDSAGNLKNLKAKSLNFFEGQRNRFDSGDWTTSLDKFDAKSRSVFDGLGKGLKELLGITEDVGGQIGAMLIENLGGNVDNARLLVYQLGISLEDITEKLVESGKTGAMSWHEIEVALQGVNEAFGSGLAAVADIKGAFDELSASGGRGMAALKGVKDIAVEALEGGAKSFEDFKAKALENGVSLELIDAFISALKQRNISSLEEIASATDRTLGGIVADIQSASPALSSKWEEMGSQVDQLTKKLNDLPSELNSKITLDIKSNIDQGTQDAINFVNSGSAALSIPSSGDLMSSTPQSSKSIPSTGQRKVSGRSAKSNVYNIDARGAAPGVEQEIKRVLRSVRSDIVNESVNKVSEMKRRGAL